MRVGPVRDSLVSMAMILQLCAETKKTVSQLVAEIPVYQMTKRKLIVDKKEADKIIEKAKKTFKKAQINTADGCRFDFEDGWIHLRMSNTEPIMRLIAEFKDLADAEDKIEKIMEMPKKTKSKK